MNIIEVKNLTYTYPDGTLAVDNISFSVRENQTLCIIGPNGAGKTTLLLCLVGVLRYRGEIKIFGETLNYKNGGDIRKNIGFLFQNPDDQLFMPTVFEDVAFAAKEFKYKEEDVEKLTNEALKKVGLEGYKNRLSHHLSYGEKKKVALASSLVLNPKILILDEPTSNFDPATRREFIELIKSLICTKIIATHDLDMVEKIADSVILINNGKKLKEAKPSEILDDKELLTQNRLI
ncbi:MAG: ABC transporter ATP-binding protein [Elusimicrobiota bacterium]|nr:energy-coupling factor ABC transporter ATP-binding protein [Endomicrobiia bacterium]MDW8165713.1 ABC transporter ATP-binding protein [Elusimicrobiota bacterium]